MASYRNLSMQPNYLHNEVIYEISCDWLKNNVNKNIFLPVKSNKKQDIWIGGIFPMKDHDVSDVVLSKSK